MPACSNCVRAASKSKRHSRWCNPGSKQCLAVQEAPQSDRAEMLLRRKRRVGEVVGDLGRRQVNVGEYNHLAFLLFQHLGPPARFPPRVEPFAAYESQVLQESNQPRKVFAAAAVGVVIVVGPAQAQGVLARLSGTVRHGCDWSSSGVRPRKTDRRHGLSPNWRPRNGPSRRPPRNRIRRRRIAAAAARTPRRSPDTASTWPDVSSGASQPR